MTRTHIGDLGVGALGVVRIISPLLLRTAKLLVHAGLLLSTPHTTVGHGGTLAETAVLPPHRAVVQGDCREKKTQPYFASDLFTNVLIPKITNN